MKTTQSRHMLQSHRPDCNPDPSCKWGVVVSVLPTLFCRFAIDSRNHSHTQACTRTQWLRCIRASKQPNGRPSAADCDMLELERVGVTRVQVPVRSPGGSGERCGFSCAAAATAGLEPHWLLLHQVTNIYADYLALT